MLDYIYEWMRNIAFYLVLITAVVHMVPDSDYKKYIRFFTGLVLILWILTPVLKLFGTDDKLADIYRNKEYMEQIERMKDYAGSFREEKEMTPEKAEEQMPLIEVKEIRIDE